MDDDNISGLIVCYAGKSGGKLQALLRLLIELRLRKLLSLIILNAELLHTGYTPELSEEDFYISLLVVDEEQTISPEILSSSIEMYMCPYLF